MKINASVSLLFIFATACSSITEYPYPNDSTIFLETEGDVLNLDTAVKFQASVETNFAKWKAKEPSHYTYIIAQSCYCLYGPAYGPNEIEVANGIAVKTTYRGEKRDGFKSGDRLSESSSLNYLIDDLFNRAKSVIDQAINGDTSARRRATPRFLIEYHHEYNYPTKLAFDDPMRADEEWVIVIENMREIE